MLRHEGRSPSHHWQSRSPSCALRALDSAWIADSGSHPRASCFFLDISSQRRRLPPIQASRTALPFPRRADVNISARSPRWRRGSPPRPVVSRSIWRSCQRPIASCNLSSQGRPSLTRDSPRSPGLDSIAQSLGSDPQLVNPADLGRGFGHRESTHPLLPCDPSTAASQAAKIPFRPTALQQLADALLDTTEVSSRKPAARLRDRPTARANSVSSRNQGIQGHVAVTPLPDEVANSTEHPTGLSDRARLESG